MTPGERPEVAAPATVPMIVARDLPVPMDDGIVLRADVFRPVEPGPFPVMIERRHPVVQTERHFGHAKFIGGWPR